MPTWLPPRRSSPILRMRMSATGPPRRANASGKARLVEPALGHYLRLALVLLVGEALNVLEQHLSVAGQDRPIDLPAPIPQSRSHQRLRAGARKSELNPSPVIEAAVLTHRR